MASFWAFLNRPVGPKTVHFWGPVANWGFVIALFAGVLFVWCFQSGLAMEKTARDDIRQHDSSSLSWLSYVHILSTVYEICMDGATMHYLLACHASNETFQLCQPYRWARGQGYLSEKKKDEASSQ